MHEQLKEILSHLEELYNEAVDGEQYNNTISARLDDACWNVEEAMRLIN